MSTKIEYFFQNTEKFPLKDFWDGITETYEILERAKTYLNELLVKPGVFENYGEIRGAGPQFFGSYHVGEGTVIYNDVTVIGPVYIGKNCEIMPGAIIRPNTIISDGCSVGHGSEIKHSVLLSGSKVASLAFVGDSVLGESGRVGSGVITANRKFNQSEVALKAGEETFALGDSYFGCILGDSSRLGANCVTQPGTHIGRHTWVFPLTNVRGFVPSEKRVYQPSALVMEDNGIVELKP